MKVNDLLRESSESIITYLALVGHDITYYEQGSATAKAQYKENPIEAYKLALKTILAEANRRIVSLLQNTELWKRLEADPEISLVYDRFVNLYNENDDFLESLR
jgi:IS1 family transposase